MAGEAEPESKKLKTGNDDEAYTPKNILLTGGAGFIGSNLAILLATKYPQYKIVVYDSLEYSACMEHLVKIQDLPNFKFIKGDICSPDITNFVLREESIDTVLHFAAQTHVDNSFGNSMTFTNSNIYGTHGLLECCKNYNEEQEDKGKRGVDRFIHVSTDEVYGEGDTFQKETEPVPKTEAHVLEPNNPYAATKAAAEYLVKSYFRSFKLPCLITRINNVYGPHQLPEKLIPKFIIQLSRDMPLTLHGDGKQKKNYLFVKDATNAFDIMLHKGIPGTVYNIGSKAEISNIQVAKDLLQIVKGIKKDGSDNEEELKKFIEYVPDRSFNDVRYPINASRLAELGWKEEITWEEGLKQTVEWYKDTNNLKRFNNLDDAVVAHPRMLQNTLVAKGKN